MTTVDRRADYAATQLAAALQRAIVGLGLDLVEKASAPRTTVQSGSGAVRFGRLA